MLNIFQFSPAILPLGLGFEGWRVAVVSCGKACYLKVSDLGSMGHFVDLDEENASVWSPSPETYLEKHRPLLASGAARRDKLQTPIRPQEASLASHAPTHAGMA